MTSTIDAPRLAAGSHRVRNVVLAALALFVVYGALSFVNDTRGTLSTDVGGKVATLRVMGERGSTGPDVGYWAAEWDPTATYHGLYYTALIDGKYVNVTTLPVLELARPLFDLGGYRAALAWSMLGGVAVAFAARALARRAGGDDRRAWLAFWLAGLASPVLLYSLDLWEHAPGLALMAWGVVAMVDVAAARPRWLALLAGLAFGAAFSMRTEAVAYGFVIVAVGCVQLWRRRGFVGALVAGALAGVGFAVMVAANYLLEASVMGASFHAERASDTAAVGGADVALRLREALTTAVGLFPSLETGPILLGAMTAVLLAWAVWRCSRPGDRAPIRIAVGGVIVLFALRAIDGMGFVPGIAATAPFAVAGLVLAFDRRATSMARDAVLMGLVSLPVVWIFQYSGGAVPQWGGRYVLTSSLVLTAVGIGSSWMIDRWLQLVLCGLSVAVAVFGLVWMSYRTHEVGRAAATVGAIDEPVVSVQDFWLRELGSRYDEDSKWLSLTGASELPEGMAILDEAGESSFVLLWAPGAPTSDAPSIPGWTATTERDEDWLGVDWRLTAYERT